jgi:hypothetical protein
MRKHLRAFHENAVRNKLLKATAVSAYAPIKKASSFSRRLIVSLFCV